MPTHLEPEDARPPAASGEGTVAFPGGDPVPAAFAPTLDAARPGTHPTSPAGDLPPSLVEGLPADLLDHPRYRVTQLLGQGGMGAVYLAEHRLMGRPVALKVIHPRFTSNGSAVERFRREVRSAARLHHANIVAAHDAEQAGLTHFLVMEYVEGITLAEHLRQKGPLPVAEACAFARQVALGLQHACERDMVHRDIKPDNLMLEADGTVKILDFGLARLGLAADIAGGQTLAEGAGPLTMAGGVMGTPDYIAPEQAADAHAADIRADLYSLGCTLYQLLSGRVPFPEGDLADKLAAHAKRTATPLEKLRRGLPPGLADVVARLMAKKPADRYQTPAAAAAALTPFAAGTSRRHALVRRLLSVSAGFGCLAAALAVGGFLVVWFGRSRPKPPDVPRSSVAGVLPFEVPSPAEFAGRAAPADALKRENLSPEALASAGGGDPAKAPAELVAVLGGPRWRLHGRGGFPSWSPDGKRVATPSGHDIRIFDENGKLVRQLVGHTNTLLTTRFSPDGKLLASTGNDATVRLWDVETGRLRNCWVGFQGNTWGVAFSPDGSALAATAEDGRARVWDIGTGRARAGFYRPDGLALHGVSFTPDGQSVVMGYPSGRLFFWSAQTGKPTRVITHGPPALKGILGHVMVAFSPDGKRMATGSDKLVRVWDFTGAEPRSLWSKPGAAVGLLAFTPDGASLWTTGHDINQAETGRVAVRWAASDGTEQARFSLETRGSFACWSLSPDGKTLAGGGSWEVDFLRLVDTGTGETRNRPAGHSATINGIAFSPDGRWLASTSNDNTARVWDLATGAERFRLAGHTGRGRGIAFSPDGRTVAGASENGTAGLWDASTGRPIGAIPHSTGIDSVAFSPDGTRLATACWDDKARLFDLTGRVLIHTLEGHSKPLTHARFDATGRRLATTSYDGTARVWGVDRGHQERVLRGHREVALWGKGVRGLATSPDNRTLATAGDDGTVRLWPWQGAAAGAVAFRVGISLQSVAASPDGRLLAACGADGNLYLHDRTATRLRLRAWRLFATGGYWLNQVAFSPEGRYLATANPDGTIYLFRLSEHGRVPQVPEWADRIVIEREFEGHTHRWINNVALSRDGSIAWTAGADQMARAWRIDDGRQVRELGVSAEAQHVALSPDGKAAVVAGFDGKLRRWRLDGDGPPQVWQGHTDRVDGLAWSGDGRRVVSGSVDGTVRVWEAATGKPLQVSRGNAGEVWSVAVDKDGTRALSSGKDGTVFLWDLQAGKIAKTWKHQPLGYGSEAVCFAPDGRRAAWAACDGTVRVHDLDADRERLRLDVGALWVRALAFTPDGKRLLAGGYQSDHDGTLTLWDAATGRELDRVRFSGGVSGIAITPDGKRAVTGHGDGKARVWRLP